MAAPAYSMAYQLRLRLNSVLLALVKRLPGSRWLISKPRPSKPSKAKSAAKAAAQQLAQIMSASSSVSCPASGHSTAQLHTLTCEHTCSCTCEHPHQALQYYPGSHKLVISAS